MGRTAGPSTHTAPLAKTIETPIFFVVVICNVQSKGMGKNKSMKSTKMLQNPKMLSTSAAFILHTVVGSKRVLKSKAPINGLQEKQTKSTVASAQTVMMAPIA